MKQTRPQFTHDALLEVVRKSFQAGLKTAEISEKPGNKFSNLDCLMAGLAVFTFKFSSLLKFDEAREQKCWLRDNLTRLFKINSTPCDTQMRTRLDEITPKVIRSAYKNIFALLQRSKVLENYRFLDKHYIVSVDGTGIFSSDKVHCEHCCVKEHQKGYNILLLNSNSEFTSNANINDPIIIRCGDNTDITNCKYEIIANPSADNTRVSIPVKNAALIKHLNALPFGSIYDQNDESHFVSAKSIIGKYIEKNGGSGINKGPTTFYHQILGAALVHPDQKVVFPLAPEPILKQDGTQKNDCERNAAKRWIADLRREHPHLPIVIVEDGLASNAPHIKELQKHNLRYILGCREGDHKYLVDWIEQLEPQDITTIYRDENGGKISHEYQYMKNVPLNGLEDAPIVTVIRYKETKIMKKEVKTTQWMWVTDLNVTPKNIAEIVRGARARFHIENQTYNTLKNQGYEFEHNFGHGKKYLSQVFAMLMMLSFLIDQCLQQVNKRFQTALAHCFGKQALWDRMLNSLSIYKYIPDFETLYEAIAHPPPFELNPVI